MFVHRSNSLENLVDGLHQTLTERVLGVLEPEIILIQSAGMERYLSRELSRRGGITANVEFPFPRSFLRATLERALGVDERAAAFERENMTWSLFSDLPDALLQGGAPFDPVKRYLEGDEDSSRRLLLSEKLAYFFDQYVTYRSRMVLAWDAGADRDDFQAILWRRLVERFGVAHFAARCHRFMNELSDVEVRAALPSRISLMGGPGLPPMFLQMLGRMGTSVPVHVFSFSVCRGYFADAHPLDEELPEIGEGVHPLLVSLGKVGADYQNILEVIGTYRDGNERFFVPQEQSLLAALQRSLVNGASEWHQGQAVEVRGALADGSDRSITIDSCHSPLREVEVLHDRLCGWFVDDPSLRPEDIVVLAPNIEEYSPLISAVFAARSGDRPIIPFRIADRSEKHTNPAARALLLAFSVLRGRLKASEILDLLQLEPVRARYEIESTDLEKVARWIRDAQIRWGIDGSHREEFDLPNDDANTWRFGLRRLLLGYALFDEGAQLFRDTVPLDSVGVGDIELVGRLMDFCENLFSLRARLSSMGAQGLTPLEWRDFSSDALDLLVEEEGRGRWDTGAVRSVIFAIAERAELGDPSSRGANARLGLRGMIHLLSTELDSSKPSTDFLAGGVTFCALLPLRTIPFRRVCVLGLNQNEFPRADGRHQLDRMAGSPKCGDRSLRADDRYLFLEVLLAARERLALSYIGRSVQDNTSKPPSVVLSELELVLAQLLGREASEGPCLPVVEHPLQPFHPDYFSGSAPRLRSFDERAFGGAQALANDPQEIAPFFGKVGDLGSSEEVEWTLDQLVRFWKDPTKAYLEAHGVRIDDSIEEIEDREPVVETGLSRYVAGDRILTQLLRGEPVRRDVELCRGELPVGQGGRVLFDEVFEVAEEIFAATAEFRVGARTPVNFQHTVPAGPSAALADFLPVGIDTAQLGFVPSLVLTGQLDQLYDSVRLETSYGRMTTSRKIGLWIRHLALCACSDPSTADSADLPRRSAVDGAGLPQRSVMVVRGSPRDVDNVEVFALAPVDALSAREMLTALLRLAQLGLHVPLQFFPAASEAYFVALMTPPAKLLEHAPEEVVPRAFSQARAVLEPEKSWMKRDGAILEVHRGRDPIGDRDEAGRPAVHWGDLSELPFARLSELVFRPLSESEGATS